MKDLYRRNELTEDQARDIIKSQFRRLRMSMEEYDLEEDNYPAIRLPKWGLFFVRPGKKKNYGKEEVI